MPASGNAPTASPSRSRLRARRYAAAGARRSTGMCRIRSIAQPTGGNAQTSWRAMNRTNRSRSTAAFSTSTKSGYDTWLIASSTGPLVGRCCSPSARTRTSSARSRPRPTALTAR